MNSINHAITLYVFLLYECNLPCNYNIFLFAISMKLTKRLHHCLCFYYTWRVGRHIQYFIISGHYFNRSKKYFFPIMQNVHPVCLKQNVMHITITFYPIFLSISCTRIYATHKYVLFPPSALNKHYIQSISSPVTFILLNE